MFWNGVYKAGRVAGPVLIHYLATILVVIVGSMGLHIVDAALLTSAAALLVLPVFLRMYREDMENGPPPASLRAGDVVFLVVLAVGCNYALTWAVNLILQALPAGLPNNIQEALFAGNPAAQVLGLGLVVPLMEEVLFRGLVYKRLRGYTKTAWSAAALSAAVFAVYHGNAIQMLFAFPMGLILASVCERWNTLKAPVIFHMAVNLSSICLNAFV